MNTEILQQYSADFMAYLPKIGLGLLTLIVGFWIVGWISKMVNRAFASRNLDPTVGGFLSSIVSVALKVLVLLSVAGMFGIQTTSFIAIFTALAFAVGTALSGSLSHFASGAMILMFRPYKVKDLVTVAGQTGEVEEIGMFNTVLRTVDNKKIIIPNNNVTSNVITNISGQGEIRVDMDFAVGNDADMDKVRSVINLVSNSCPTLLKSKPVDIFVNSMTPGGTQLVVRPWCKSEHYWDTYFYYREGIRKAFAQNGIPGPKMELPS